MHFISQPLQQQQLPLDPRLSFEVGFSHVVFVGDFSFHLPSVHFPFEYLVNSYLVFFSFLFLFYPRESQP